MTGEKNTTVQTKRRDLIKMIGAATTLTMTQPIKAQEDLDEANRIWPIRTDAPGDTCTNKHGQQLPTTGENSATWFVWSNCGTWKEFPVIAGETYRIRAATNHSEIIDSRHEIQERIDDAWTTTHSYQKDLGRGKAEIYTYTPETNLIRIQNIGSKGFYVQVYGPRSIQPDGELTAAVDDKIELAQHIDRISPVFFDDESQASESTGEIIKSNRPEETKLEGVDRLINGEEITEVTLSVLGPHDSEKLDESYNLSRTGSELALWPVGDLGFIRATVQNKAPEIKINQGIDLSTDKIEGLERDLLHASIKETRAIDLIEEEEYAISFYRGILDVERKPSPEEYRQITRDLETSDVVFNIGEDALYQRAVSENVIGIPVMLEIFHDDVSNFDFEGSSELSREAKDRAIDVMERNAATTEDRVDSFLNFVANDLNLNDFIEVAFTDGVDPPRYVSASAELVTGTQDSIKAIQRGRAILIIRQTLRIHSQGLEGVRLGDPNEITFEV